MKKYIFYIFIATNMGIQSGQYNIFNDSDFNVMIITTSFGKQLFAIRSFKKTTLAKQTICGGAISISKLDDSGNPVKDSSGNPISQPLQLGCLSPIILDLHIQNDGKGGITTQVITNVRPAAASALTSSTPKLVPKSSLPLGKKNDTTATAEQTSAAN